MSCTSKLLRVSWVVSSPVFCVRIGFGEVSKLQSVVFYGMAGHWMGNSLFDA